MWKKSSYYYLSFPTVIIEMTENCNKTVWSVLFTLTTLTRRRPCLQQEGHQTRPAHIVLDVKMSTSWQHVPQGSCRDSLHSCLWLCHVQLYLTDRPLWASSSRGSLSRDPVKERKKSENVQHEEWMWTACGDARGKWPLPIAQTETQAPLLLKDCLSTLLSGETQFKKEHFTPFRFVNECTDRLTGRALIIQF